jgi:multidrug resistance efflux pump
VLVATTLGAAAVPLPESAIAVLRASFGLAEPLLRHWRNADRGLFRHAFDSLGQSRRKLVGPGHLAWKFAAACCAVGLVVLLFLPFTDRVSASTVIEGRQRQIVTAPFDGFLREVRVRPGAEVRRGQLLARLDDRELRLELTRDRSEGEQAAGHLRQAMTEHDAPALALALAEVQQAEARLSLVEAKLARTDLVAPADGLVVNGDWVQQIGSPIESGKELFEIASGQGYRVVLQVPDREIARVRPGQTGVLRLTGQPQAMHTFRVSTVTATASVQDGVNGFRVEAEWVGAVPPLSPGMQGVGKIEVGQANLLTIWTRSSIDWVRLKIWAWL